MVMNKSPILMADDDEDYCLVIKDVLKGLGIVNELKCVEDGDALMDYLLRRKKYENPANSPRPGLIFLDINMPKKTGIEILRELRAEALLRAIPVIMLTASDDPKEVAASYSFGANAFVTKPAHFQELKNVMRILTQYWLEVVTLPGENS